MKFIHAKSFAMHPRSQNLKSKLNKNFRSKLITSSQKPLALELFIFREPNLKIKIHLPFNYFQ